MYNQIKKRINELHSDHILTLSKQITLTLLNQLEYKCAKSIHLYESIQNEVDTQYILNHAKKSSKDIHHPTIDPYHNERNIDLIIIPGIIFDKRLTRHGRGKGYYDKFLNGIKSIKCAIAYDFQVIKDGSLHRQDHDIPMDMIVTEKMIYKNHDKYTQLHIVKLIEESVNQYD